MLRSLDALRLFLGMPVYRSVVGDGPDSARVSAYWACGCTASGLTFAKLNLKSCSSHRAGRIAVPALV